MRQPRNGNLRQLIKIHHAYARCISIIQVVQGTPYRMPFHNYFCYVISNKFPRLLAEREIIANALFYQRCLGKGQAQSERKITNKYRHTPTFHHKTSKNFLPDCSLSGCFGYFCIDNVKKRQRRCFSLNYSATGSPRLAATSS